MKHRVLRALPSPPAKRSHTKDAGSSLCRMERLRQVEIIGDDPATCQVRLLSPALTRFTDMAILPITAWEEAHAMAQLPRAYRDRAIQRAIVKVHAGFAVMQHLAAQDCERQRQDVYAHVAYNQAFVVAHYWFLLFDEGVRQGNAHYTQLANAIDWDEVADEAQIALAGIAALDDADGQDDNDPRDRVGGWLR